MAANDRLGAFRSTIVWLSLPLVAALMAGCGGCKTEDPQLDEPQIVSFSVEPGSITLGETATLSWETAHAVSIEIAEENGGLIDIGDAEIGEGSVTVSPAATTRYTMTATGEEGTEPVTAEITLTVVDPDAPVVISFSASPSEALQGSEVVLSWETSNGESIEIVDDGAGALELGEVSAAADVFTVNPTETTTYTLTVTGPGGQATADTTVTVRAPASVVSFTADPNTPVIPGTEVTLSWETEGALSVSLLRGSDLIHTSDSELDGSYVVIVDLLSEFTLVAEGLIGSQDSSTLVVPVIPIIESFEADATLVRPGDMVEFTWTTLGAERVILTGPGGLSHEATGLDAISGGHTVAVNQAGVFSLTAESGLLDDVATVSIATTNAPRIVSLTAAPEELTAGGITTIAWVTQGSTSLSLEVTGIGAVDLGGRDIGSDQVDVTLDEPGSVVATLTATNADGEAQAQVTIDVLAVPVIESFSAMPVRVGAGESVELSWQTANAATIRIEKNGADIGVASDLINGSVSDTVTEESSYVLVAANALGHEVSSGAVIVTIAAPEIVSFDSSAGHVGPSNDVTFSWQNIGGNQLFVRLGADVVCQSTARAEISSGDCVVAAPAEIGSYFYDLEVTNGAGTDTAQLELYVSDGPIITSFEVSAPVITLGESFELTWSVSDDAAGVTPAITMVDDLAAVYDLSAFDPNQDSAQIEPDALGARTYTFTASTDGTTAATREFVVEVVAAPVIVAFTGDPLSIDTQGGTVTPESTLSWTVETSVRAAIFALDLGGAIVEPAIHELLGLDVGQQQSGTLAVTPAITTDYVLVASNAAGLDVTAQLRVIVDPASIVSFTAEAADGTIDTTLDILEGETVTLAWETEQADKVVLGSGDGAASVAEISETLIDISSSGTLLSLSGDYSAASLVFPVGFTFPYYGTDRTQIRVTTDGFLSFNMTASSSSSNTTLPNYVATRSPVIAPFWDDLVVRQVYWEHQPAEDRLIIHYHDAYRWNETAGSLNFQLILYGDGSFEYRYGTMSSPTADNANGAKATIGFENDDGTDGNLITFNQAVVGGLENRAWRVSFEEEVALSGDMDVSPTSTTTYTLLAYSAQLDDTATVEVIVHPAVSQPSATVTPDEIEVGGDFIIEWTVDNATRVQVLDEVGNIACDVVVETLDATSGTCEFTAPVTVGTYTYTVVAFGTLGRDQQSLDVDVLVEQIFRLNDFSAVGHGTGENVFITSGESVTVSWSAEGAGSASLFVDGIQADITAQNPNAGSYALVGITENTQVTFTVFDATGRSRTATVMIYVDAASVDSFASSETEILAGESTTLSWGSTNADEVTLVPAAPPIVTEISDTFMDISTTGTHLDQITGWSASNRRQSVTFPTGFVFPYYGVDRTEMQVMIHSGIYFDMATTGNYTGSTFPNSGASNPRLALFWDDLDAKSADDKVYWEHRVLPDSRQQLIVQWNVQFYATARNPSTLQFQIVMYDDGVFEYRYGTMTANNYTTGMGQTAGFQNDDGTEGYTLFHREEVPGGLSNRSWRFEFAQLMGESGTLDIYPTETTVYEFCATGGGYTDCQEVEVIVHPAVTQPVVTISPAEIEIGDAFELNWTVSNATRVRVFDEVGVLICDDVVETLASTSGTCPATASGVAGTYTYEVVATGSLARDEQTRQVDVLVRPLFAIGSFAPSAEFITEWEPVTFSWTTMGAASGTLQGSFGTYNIPVADLENGSWTVPSFSATNSFTLTILDGTGRTRSQTTTVYVNAASLDSFTASETVITAGETVTLSWATTNADSVTVSGAGGSGISVTEISAPLIDIMGSGTLLPLSGDHSAASLVFPAGFSFPYYGTDRTQIRVTTDGFLSFNMSASAAVTNTTLPNFVSTRSPVIAPFWDDLVATQVFWKHEPSQDRLIIHYHDAYRYGDYSSSLNFQLVLYGNGTFEYRYGTMSSPTPNNANGANATIGFENDDGTEGHLITFNQAIAGGLTGKAWRFSGLSVVAASGTMDVSPDKTTTYEICVTGGGFTECQEVTVVVIAPGMFMVSELMPLSSVGPDGQWIELYNTTPAAIDLQGWALAVDADEHLIASSVVVEPGGYVVLGRSGDTALNGGYVPDYVYGADLTMSATGSTIELLYGTVVIDAFTYDDVDFVVASGVSLSLKADRLTGDPADNTDSGFWCEPTTSFGTAGQFGSPGEENDLLDCAAYQGNLTYTSTPSLAIPDSTPTGVTDVQAVAEFCTVGAVNVDLNLTHTYIGDLVVRLIAPGGTQVTLHDLSGGSAEDIIGNYPGTLTPAQSLDGFVGLEGMGDWTLFVSDNAGGDIGTVNSWTLNLTCI